MQATVFERRARARAWFGVVVGLHATCAAVAFAGELPVSSTTSPPPRRTAVVDHMVVPAGIGCRHCGNATCRMHCGHAAECRDGFCAPHCPVRPSQYGYYSTRWRRWPGQGVMPVSAEDAATPVSPPKSQVPAADEESPALPAGEAPEADAAEPSDASAAPRRMPARPVPEEPLGDPADEGIPPGPGRDGAETDAPQVPPTPPGDEPIPPLEEDPAMKLLEESVEPPAGSPPTDRGAMRYPAPVGRSVAAGATPWRLETSRRQRAADSARGL